MATQFMLKLGRYLPSKTVLRHLKLHFLQLTLNIGIIKLGQPLLDWLLLFNSFQLKHLKRDTHYLAIL